MRISSIIILLLSVVSIISCKKSVETEVITQSQQQQSQQLVEQSAELETVVTTESAEVVLEKTAEPIKKEAEKVVPRKRAKLVFNEKKYNYGMIAQGDKVQHDFVFTNTGDADLVIKSADATCGCTTPEYPFVPIKPGKTGKIGVKFNSTGKLGPQKPMVTLVTNASPKVYRIYLNGFVNSAPKEAPELIEEAVEMEVEGNMTKGEGEVEVIDN
jgi:hypothetical protein